MNRDDKAIDDLQRPNGLDRTKQILDIDLLLLHLNCSQNDFFLETTNLNSRINFFLFPHSECFSVQSELANTKTNRMTAVIAITEIPNSFTIMKCRVCSSKILRQTAVGDKVRIAKVRVRLE